MKLLLALMCLASAAHADVSDSGNLSIGGQGVIAGTMTVQGNAFSVGGTTFSVAGGSITLGGRLNAAAAGIKWADGTISTTAASGGGAGGDALLSTTQTFTGANTYASSFTIRSGGRDILLSTYTAAGANASARIRGTDGRLEYRTIAVRAYNSSDRTVSNNTLTTLTYDSERYDTDGMHSTASNTDRLTANTAGVYTICANVRWESNSSGIRLLRILLNGSSAIAEHRYNHTSGENMIDSLCTQWHLAAGDYATSAAYQTSGGNLNIQRSEAESLEFSMTYNGGL